VAIGLEDHWHSLDAEIGAAYFGDLVRYAREFGIEVPLITANNCWHMHEGVVDTWCRESDDPAARMAELRQVQPDAPPMSFLSWDEDARRVASRAIVRSDFVLEVSGGRHRGATSASGLAERPARDLFDLRRALVFASSFGEVLAKLSAEEVAARVEMRARSNGGVDFFGRDLALNGARFDRCTPESVRNWAMAAGRSCGVLVCWRAECGLHVGGVVRAAGPHHAHTAGCGRQRQYCEHL
jgi:hypothetical protein